MSSEYFFEEAKKRVKKKKGFYGHLSAFCAVGFFFLILSIVSGDIEAFLVPMGAWSIGLIIHYLSIFGFPGKNKILSQEWEQKEINKEMRQMGAPLNNVELDELELKEMVKRKDGYIDDDLV